MVVLTRLTGRTARRLPRRLSGLYGKGVRVLPAGGDHWTMLRPPHMQALARSLLTALPAADPTSTGRSE